MLLMKNNGKVTIHENGIEQIIEQYYKENGFSYDIQRGENGKIFVNRFSVPSCFCHVSLGNSKTGNAINYNLPIEYTCKHNCECYKLCDCYACQGCYQFPSNQAEYSENLNYYMNSTKHEMIHDFQLVIDTTDCKLWRNFTCGDIPDSRFIDIFATLAKKNPQVEFWMYTKKYAIVNRWIKNNGMFPHNLKIIFSHWMNRDKTYYPMENPYNLPTSEFIPLGMEYLLESITHVCPCSSPDSVATCETCDKPCYRLQLGEKMGLCEHSTKATKQRDKELKQAKQALKEKAKQEKRNAKQAKKNKVA